MKPQRSPVVIYFSNTYLLIFSQQYSNAGDVRRTCHSNDHTQKQIKMKCLELPWVVKLKRAGVSRPFGSLTFGSRNSSKNECAQASSGVNRAVGVYSSRRLHRAIASGGVRGRKTWEDKEVDRTIKFYYKNLNKKSFEFWVSSHYKKTWLQNPKLKELTACDISQWVNYLLIHIYIYV